MSSPLLYRCPPTGRGASTRASQGLVHTPLGNHSEGQRNKGPLSVGEVVRACGSVRTQPILMQQSPRARMVLPQFKCRAQLNRVFSAHHLFCRHHELEGAQQACWAISTRSERQDEPRQVHQDHAGWFQLVLWFELMLEHMHLDTPHQLTCYQSVRPASHR